MDVSHGDPHHDFHDIATLEAKKFGGTYFLGKVIREPFGSWTSAPKIVDVRAQRSAFLRHR